ncbi:MAG TPA: hypothetical protein VEC35_09400 [Noviherbaspirillum sp.]|nr:hypothetical protein [Noviherbaspirillum sp.]
MDRATHTAYLVAIIEVPKEERVLCQAEGCGHTVYKRIHIVYDNGNFKVVGSECFKRLYGEWPYASQQPRYGSYDSRSLTVEECAELIAHTDRFVSRLEFERLEAERIRAEIERQRAAEAEARRQEEMRRETERRINRLAGVAHYGRRQVFVGPLARPRQDLDEATNIPVEELARLRKQARDIVQVANPGVDINAPGWAGLINVELKRLIREWIAERLSD